MSNHIIWEDDVNETVFGNSYLLARDEYIDGKHRVKNITIEDLMRDLNFIDHTGPVDNLAVVWYYEDEDQYITQIYDHDTGEIYWENPTDDEWSDEDDEITNALLMWGNLEQTIDGGNIY